MRRAKGQPLDRHARVRRQGLSARCSSTGRATEQLIDISELDELLTVTATFESWDFRWAYVIRYAADYRLTVEQRRELLERTLRETETRHEFYVALYGTNWRWTT